jgi:hypothetical protein
MEKGRVFLRGTNWILSWLPFVFRGLIKFRTAFTLYYFWLGNQLNKIYFGQVTDFDSLFLIEVSIL